MKLLTEFLNTMFQDHLGSAAGVAKRSAGGVGNAKQ